ncbi:YetF domain-containing protein [Mammaliicoccus sciuri]|uniref:YetF domain-containing protein n=1 Tax=Mammaliicoccus sciuri TaxID=1296 RepID=UPI00384EE7DD
MFEYLIYKSKKARFILKGDTDVLMTEGDIYTKILKYNRLELDQIHSIARNQGIFDLSEIKNMYIESDDVASLSKSMIINTPLKNMIMKYMN